MTGRQDTPVVDSPATERELDPDLTPVPDSAVERSPAWGEKGADVPPDVHRIASGRRRAGLFALALGSGFGVMVVEIAGARVMAPAFGLSAVPWTAVIGVILGALALGNWVGGRWADRGRPSVGWLLAGAGVTALLPVVGTAVPGWAVYRLGFIPGALATATLLFAPAVFFLGAVTPALVRADTAAVTSVGRRAGDVGAAATVGSIAGTFATGFVLLPAFPLPLLLGLTAAGFLALAGLAAVVLGRGSDGRGPSRGMLLMTGGVALALGTGGWAEPASLLHREETLYASVRVTESEWSDGRMVHELWQNGGSSSAEEVPTGEPAHPYAIAVEALLGPAMGRVDSVLVLGGAALTLPVALARRRPDLTIDVVELDPAVTRLARTYFAYGSRDEWPGVRVMHGDARLFLRRATAHYDVIIVDVFDHLVTVPWTMVTVEALAGMRDRLAAGGLVVVNMLTPLAGSGAGFLQRLLATATEVFPAVRAYPVVVDVSPEATRNVLIVAAASEDALPAVDWQEVALGPAGRPLTDAHAPVEYLQARVFWEGLSWY